LVREAVVLLSRPRARLDVVYGAEVASPIHFPGDLVELGVLHHHGVDDAEKGLVAGEERRPTRQRVSLHEALASVLGEYLNDPAAFRARVLVPLEVAARVV